jgi:hypothetical protein
MDDLGSSMALGGGDQKSIVMNRVRQEAAMTNARQLIEVRSPFSYSPVLLFGWGKIYIPRASY